MENKPIKIFIIDNTMIYREILPVYLLNEPSIDVVGTGYNKDEVFARVAKSKPDVIVVNVDMSDKEIEIFFLNLNKIVVNATVVVTSNSYEKAAMAMGHGATDYITKPDVSKADDLKKFAIQFVIDIKRIYSRKASPVKTDAFKNISHMPVRPAVMGKSLVVAIGASTGGVEALVNVITRLPINMPPILITQHMPEKFTDMFAKRLNGLSKLDVSEAVDGTRIKCGHVYIAAGKYHMRLHCDKDGYFISSRQGEKVSGHCPSVDVLFTSVAKAAKSNAIGVILTGMGRDGADGLLEMKKAGASTIGQDKESSVVYGMPMVAYEIGAVDVQKPIDNIADEIIRQIKGKGVQ